MIHSNLFFVNCPGCEPGIRAVNMQLFETKSPGRKTCRDCLFDVCWNIDSSIAYRVRITELLLQ